MNPTPQGNQGGDLRRMLMMAAAWLLAIVLAPASLAAQAPEWDAGEVLRAGDGAEPGTTGTLTLVSRQRERRFDITPFANVAAFQFLRLSGERELPMEFVDKEPGRMYFEGSGAQLTISAISSTQVIAEYETDGETQGLAFLGVNTRDRETSISMSLEVDGVIYESARGVLRVKAVGGQSFRERTARGYRVVVPMEEDTIVRIAISLEPLTDQEIEDANLALAPAQKKSGGREMAAAASEPLEFSPAYKASGGHPGVPFL